LIRNRAAITGSSFLTMFFLGVGATIIGAAARNIGLSPYQIGLMLTVQNIGFMLSVIVAGAVGDTYQKPRILFIGSLVLALSYWTFYMKSSFLLNLLIMFFIGAGIGTYEGVTDAMLLDIHTRREGLYININHFFVTFGSLMITLYLVFLQMNWRLSLTQSAVVVVALALFFVFVKIEGRAKKVDPLSTRVRFLIQQPVVGLLFVATICTVGLEMGSVGIMTTYLMELRGFDQVTSKLGLIIFLAGIAVGRVLVGVFTKKDWIFTNILLLFGFSTLFMTLLYYIDWGAASYVVIFITGLTVSSLLPLIITFAGLKYSEMTGTVLGIIKIGIAIGGILIPFILSIVSKYGSLRASLAIYPLSGAVSFCLLYFNRKKFADHGSR